MTNSREEAAMIELPQVTLDRRRRQEEVDRLELAAPALLKAARRACAVFKAQGESARKGNVVAALEEAIAQATGGQP